MTSKDTIKLTYNADGTITRNPCTTTTWDTVVTIADSGYVANYVSSDCCSHEHKPAKKEEAPAGATNLLVTKDKRIKVKNCKDGFVETTKDIMPDIKEVSVSADGVNSTVIIVTFTDGTTEKAILDPEDDFSLEHGLTIIMLEKLLSDKGVDGKSVHNKLVKHAIKFYKNQEETKAKEIAKQKEEKARIQRIKEKIRSRKAKKAHDEKEYQIEIQKEAYLRAMREIKKEN